MDQRRSAGGMIAKSTLIRSIVYIRHGRSSNVNPFRSPEVAPKKKIKLCDLDCLASYTNRKNRKRPPSKDLLPHQSRRTPLSHDSERRKTIDRLFNPDVNLAASLYLSLYSA